MMYLPSFSLLGNVWASITKAACNINNNKKACFIFFALLVNYYNFGRAPNVEKLLSLPKELVESLKGLTGFDEASFLKVHESAGQVTSVRLNPMKLAGAKKWEGIEPLVPVPWSSQGFYLNKRPSFTMDPVFHAGAYYVQEASSMFLEQVIHHTVDLNNRIRVLDLCAAPGGKSTLIQSLISEESLLVSNEVIRSRVITLRENMIKWGGSNVFVTNNDPMDFSTLVNFFDVILVDAPCSGSGLFRKDPEAISEWSTDQVNTCSRRQERIISDVWPALCKDGVFIYATCSYSKQENEDVLDWLMSAFPTDSIEIPVNPDWMVTKVITDKHKAFGYRFYPNHIEGEGFFIACLKKKGGSLFNYPKNKKTEFDRTGRKEQTLLDSWLKPQIPYACFKRDDFVHAIPEALLHDLHTIQSTNFLKKAGIRLGKLIDNDLIPDHELAMSRIAAPEIPAITLSKGEAIQFLRKEDLRLNISQKGWAMVRYLQQSLGWIKVLDKRINNYYPKEWRITKAY